MQSKDSRNELHLGLLLCFQFWTIEIFAV